MVVIKSEVESKLNVSSVGYNASESAKTLSQGAHIGSQLDTILQQEGNYMKPLAQLEEQVRNIGNEEAVGSFGGSMEVKPNVKKKVVDVSRSSEVKQPRTRWKEEPPPEPTIRPPEKLSKEKPPSPSKNLRPEKPLAKKTSEEKPSLAKNLPPDKPAPIPTKAQVREEVLDSSYDGAFSGWKMNPLEQAMQATQKFPRIVQNNPQNYQMPAANLPNQHVAARPPMVQMSPGVVTQNPQIHPGYLPNHPQNLVAARPPMVQMSPGVVTQNPQIQPGYLPNHPQNLVAARPPMVQMSPGVVMPNPQVYNGHLPNQPQNQLVAARPSMVQALPGHFQRNPQIHPGTMPNQPQNHPSGGFPVNSAVQAAHTSSSFFVFYPVPMQGTPVNPGMMQMRMGQPMQPQGSQQTPSGPKTSCGRKRQNQKQQMTNSRNVSQQAPSEDAAFRMAQPNHHMVSAQSELPAGHSRNEWRPAENRQMNQVALRTPATNPQAGQLVRLSPEEIVRYFSTQQQTEQARLGQAVQHQPSLQQVSQQASQPRLQEAVLQDQRREERSVQQQTGQPREVEQEVQQQTAQQQVIAQQAGQQNVQEHNLSTMLLTQLVLQNSMILQNQQQLLQQQQQSTKVAEEVVDVVTVEEERKEVKHDTRLDIEFICEVKTEGQKTSDHATSPSELSPPKLALPTPPSTPSQSPLPPTLLLSPIAETVENHGRADPEASNDNKKQKTLHDGPKNSILMQKMIASSEQRDGESSRKRHGQVEDAVAVKVRKTLVEPSEAIQKTVTFDETRRSEDVDRSASGAKAKKTSSIRTSKTTKTPVNTSPSPSSLETPPETSSVLKTLLSMKPTTPMEARSSSKTSPQPPPLKTSRLSLETGSSSIPPPPSAPILKTLSSPSASSSSSSSSSPPSFWLPPPPTAPILKTPSSSPVKTSTSSSLKKSSSPSSSSPSVKTSSSSENSTKSHEKTNAQKLEAMITKKFSQSRTVLLEESLPMPVKNRGRQSEIQPSKVVHFKRGSREGMDADREISESNDKRYREAIQKMEPKHAKAMREMLKDQQARISAPKMTLNTMDRVPVMTEKKKRKPRASQPKNYVCEKCGAAFGYRGFLKRHQEKCLQLDPECPDLQ